MAEQHLISDTDLLQMMRTASSRDRGFKLLLDQYQERLYWQIRRLVTEHDDASDVLQNALVKIIRNIDRFQEQSKLYTWMYRIATNEALSFLERQKRKGTTSIDGTTALQLAAATPFDEGHTEQLLQTAIRSLPKRQQEVFNLRYFEDRSYQDIADLLNLSVGSLKASYHHAVKKIEATIKAASLY